jgi:hypothetical protein
MNKNYKIKKAQSMLEYLILFISVVAAGLIGTNALMGPAMRQGLVNMQNTAANDLINNPNPPAAVTSQPYYTPPKTETTATPDNGWVEPQYAGSQGGAAFEANTYYFREGPSDMSYVPKQGQVLDSYTEVKAPPANQAFIIADTQPGYSYYNIPNPANPSNFRPYYYPNYKQPEYYQYYYPNHQQPDYYEQ